MATSSDSRLARRTSVLGAAGLIVTAVVAVAVVVVLGQPNGSTPGPVAGSVSLGSPSPAAPSDSAASPSSSGAASSAPSASPSAALLPPIGSSVVSVASPFGSCSAGAPGTGPGSGGGEPNRPVAQTDSEVEPSVAVDPSDPSRIVVAWQQDRWTNAAARGIGVAATSDGGRTWHRSWPAFSVCEGASQGLGGEIVRVSDPWVAVTADGTFLVTALGVNAGAQLSAVLVARSTDGGMTWSTPVAVAHDATPVHFNDKEAITADPAVPGRAWIVWDRTGGSPSPGEAATPSPSPGPSGAPRAFSADVMLVSTGDGGVTWSAPKAIFDGAPNEAMIGNQLAVLPDGTLLDVAELLIDSGLRDARTEIGLLRSADGGATWSSPAVVATVTGYEVDDPRSKRAIRAGWAIPDIAVDRPSGRVYVAWADTRFPGAKPGIALSISTDDGATWSVPTRVDAAIPGASTFTPTVEVAPDGTIGVTYYAASAAGAASGPWNTAVMLAVSADGAKTWTRRALTSPFDLHAAPDSGGLFLGDYAGLAAAGGLGGTRFVAANSVTTSRAPADPTDLVVTVAAAP